MKLLHDLVHSSSSRCLIHQLFLAITVNTKTNKDTTLKLALLNPIKQKGTALQKHLCEASRSYETKSWVSLTSLSVLLQEVLQPLHQSRGHMRFVPASAGLLSLEAEGPWIQPSQIFCFPKSSTIGIPVFIEHRQAFVYGALSHKVLCQSDT